MSQIFCLGLNFYFMTKNGLLLCLLVFFFKFSSSTYNKTKTKAYIKNVRHLSLHIHLRNIHTHFQADKCNNK